MKKMSFSCLLSLAIVATLALFTACNKDKKEPKETPQSLLLNTVPQDASMVVAIGVDAIMDAFEQKELEEMASPQIVAQIKLFKKNLDTQKAILFGRMSPMGNNSVITTVIKDYNAFVETITASGATIEEKSGFSTAQLSPFHIIFDKDQVWVCSLSERDKKLAEESFKLKKEAGQSIRSISYIRSILDNEMGIYLNLKAIISGLDFTDATWQKPALDDINKYNTCLLGSISLKKDKFAISAALLDDKGNALGDKHNIARAIDKTLLDYLELKQDIFAGVAIKNEAFVKILENLTFPAVQQFMPILSAINGTVVIAINAKSTAINTPKDVEGTILIQTKGNSAAQLFPTISDMLSDFHDKNGSKDGNDLALNLPFGDYVFGFRENVLYLAPTPLAKKPQPNYNNHPIASTLIQNDMGYIICDMKSNGTIAHIAKQVLDYPLNGYAVLSVRPDGATLLLQNEAASIASLIHKIVMYQKRYIEEE